MKIGIVTCWWSKDNYGAILQTYALQKYLRDLGHDAYIIKFDIYGNTGLSRLKDYVKYFLYQVGVYKNISYRKNLKQRKLENKWNNLRDFDSFRKEFVSMTETTYKGINDVRKNPPEADVYITGSDQVWGVNLATANHQIFYLSFGDQKIQRISYAASFGSKTLPCKDTDLFGSLVSSFNAISVREVGGINILHEYGINAVRCCDSTLLLQSDIYCKLLSKRKYNFDYSYFYTVNVSTPEEILWPEISALFNSLGLRLVVTTGGGYKRAEELFDGAIYDYSKVGEWLSNIYYSTVVVTASFHGIVFSLLFRKNFIYVPLKSSLSKGNDRIFDLLKITKLESRVARTIDDVKSIINSPIDYSSLKFEELDKLVTFSKSFLDKSINYDNR